MLPEFTAVRESKKIIVISNPPIFNKDGKEKEKEVLYDHWLLQMRNKMTANEKMMSVDIFKKVYVQSQVSSNTLTQLEPQLRKNNFWLFATVNKILDTLTSTFDDPNQK